jgi:Lipocalin-like domain
MRPRAVFVLLVAISIVVSGSTQQRNAHATSPVDISGTRRQLVGAWRLISRVVSWEDGTPVQDPDLGATPRGYLIYDLSGHMAVQIMRLDRPAAT